MSKTCVLCNEPWACDCKEEHLTVTVKGKTICMMCLYGVDMELKDYQKEMLCKLQAFIGKKNLPETRSSIKAVAEQVIVKQLGRFEEVVEDTLLVPITNGDEIDLVRMDMSKEST